MPEGSVVAGRRKLIDYHHLVVHHIASFRCSFHAKEAAMLYACRKQPRRMPEDSALCLCRSRRERARRDPLLRRRNA